MLHAGDHPHPVICPMGDGFGFFCFVFGFGFAGTSGERTSTERVELVVKIYFLILLFFFFFFIYYVSPTMYRQLKEM